MESDSSTGAAGPRFWPTAVHGYLAWTLVSDVAFLEPARTRALLPALRETEGGIVHQQPPRRLPWMLYPACSVLDDDFDSSISPLEQKSSSGFQHAQRLAERGLFVGKEHDAELAHDCFTGGVPEG